MKRIALVAFAAASTALAAPAFAGGMAEPVVEAAPAPIAVAPVAVGRDWTGFYVGGGLGYGTASGTGFATGVNGAVYNAFGGYNYDMGNVVLGGELEYGGAKLTDPNTGISFKSLARIKGKVGYDAGNFLPYVTAGAGYLSTNANGNGWGWNAGGGLDYAVSDTITVGGEVLYNRWNNFNGSGTQINATTATARVSFNF